MSCVCKNCNGYTKWERRIDLFTTIFMLSLSVIMLIGIVYTGIQVYLDTTPGNLP